MINLYYGEYRSGGTPRLVRVDRRRVCFGDVSSSPIPSSTSSIFGAALPFGNSSDDTFSSVISISPLDAGLASLFSRMSGCRRRYSVWSRHKYRVDAATAVSSAEQSVKICSERERGNAASLQSWFHVFGF